MKKIFLTAFLAVPVFFSGCNKDEGINIFSINDDIKLGQQTKAEIEAHPNEFPLLNENTHQAAYTYIRNMRDDILAGSKLTHQDDFPWEIYIIDKDDIRNAFCTPGGYIYVYTGLIKYLDSKSALAGVLGHEMAHADKRHATEQLTKKYGVQTLLDVLLGNNQGLLTQIATSLVSLKFSRNDETEADKYSVIYLCPTKYRADGAADFFQKIIDQGGSNPPEFLSTHPNPDNRVEHIEEQAQSMGCSSTISQTEEINSYDQFKAAL